MISAMFQIGATAFTLCHRASGTNATDSSGWEQIMYLLIQIRGHRDPRRTRRKSQLKSGLIQTGLMREGSRLAEATMRTEHG